MTCTPTGLELCFDATDNNCNGIIDEGCGVQTGPLQFAIAWAEGIRRRSQCHRPQGRTRQAGRPHRVGADQRSRLRPAAELVPRPEHGKRIFRGRDPAQGELRQVEIKLDNPDEVRGPVKVRFGGRIGVKTFSLDVQLAAAGDAKAPGVARSEAAPSGGSPFPSSSHPTGPAAPTSARTQEPPYTVETALGVVGVSPR